MEIHVAKYGNLGNFTFENQVSTKSKFSAFVNASSLLELMKKLLHQRATSCSLSAAIVCFFSQNFRERNKISRNRENSKSCWIWSKILSRARPSISLVRFHFSRISVKFGTWWSASSVPHIRTGGSSRQEFHFKQGMLGKHRKIASASGDILFPFSTRTTYLCSRSKFVRVISTQRSELKFLERLFDTLVSLSPTTPEFISNG